MARANLALLTHEELQPRLDELYRSLDQYNDGYFFESHETLEDLWYVTPWPERQFFQGIIQLAAAFVHLARREFPGIIKLLDLSLGKLSEFTPEYLGVDVARLISDTARARAELAALGPERFLAWDQSRIPNVAYTRAT